MKLGFALLFLVLTAAGAPHKVVRQTPALEFSYEWPAEAAATPALDLRLYTEAKRKLAEAQEGAGEDHLQFQKEGRGSVRDFYLREWTAAGQTDRLLSLQSRESEYGCCMAHPNTSFNALLWDRKETREIHFGALFADQLAFSRLVRSSYCHKLYDERTKRNGEKTGEVFEMCPKFSELAILPADSDGDGKFDQIHVIASPYVAGAYGEGTYDVSLRVTAALIAALKPEYRSSFEARRQ